MYQSESYSSPIHYGDNSFRDGVATPFLQALITGLLAGLAAGALAGWLHNEASWRIGFIAGACAALAGWLAYRAKWSELLERLLGLDDGAPVEQPPLMYYPEREPVKVIVSEDNGNRNEFIDLPVKPEQLKALADGLRAGRMFSLTAWTGQGAPFSRAEFEALRGELIRRGLAVWRNPRAQAQGVELTASGRAVLKHFASEAASPYPTARMQ